MRFASLRQIITMTLLWTATLYGVDYVKRPRPLGEIMSPPESIPASASKPRVTLALDRLCCSNCLDDLRRTVAKFPWAASGRAITLDRPEGLTKLIIDPKTERVLGVGIVGVGAGERRARCRVCDRPNRDLRCAALSVGGRPPARLFSGRNRADTAHRGTSRIRGCAMAR